MKYFLFLSLFLCSCMQGPTGPTGPAGEKGEQGKSGNNGSNGANGSQGEPGLSVVIDSLSQITARKYYGLYKGVYRYHTKLYGWNSNTPTVKDTTYFDSCYFNLSINFNFDATFRHKDALDTIGTIKAQSGTFSFTPTSDSIYSLLNIKPFGSDMASGTYLIRRIDSTQIQYKPNSRGIILKYLTFSQNFLLAPSDSLRADSLILFEWKP